ncbi:MAG: DUF4392 domain-containing protein [Synergistaceae bacterium]|jgi:hypothetical protein|nr:DUF4392 domain-containing protein [Synergistaceae bacterium]
MKDDEIFHRLTEISAGGISGRGPSLLCTDGLWTAALDIIRAARNTAVITGFFIASADAPETDGPSGSVVLARALMRAGIETDIWTDARCLGVLSICAESISFPADRVRNVSDGIGRAKQPGLLIYVERLGRAADGAYYDMRGKDVSKVTAPLDEYALNGASRVIGIGDGGNEAGMGNYMERLCVMMPDYAMCLSSVRADVCIPVDVSNWGAYALSAALSRDCGVWLGQTQAEEAAMLEAMASAGAVDGTSKKNALSVDGFDMSKQLEIVSSLRSLF